MEDFFNVMINTQLFMWIFVGNDLFEVVNEKNWEGVGAIHVAGHMHFNASLPTHTNLGLSDQQCPCYNYNVTTNSNRETNPVISMPAVVNTSAMLHVLIRLSRYIVDVDGHSLQCRHLCPLNKIFI